MTRFEAPAQRVRWVGGGALMVSRLSGMEAVSCHREFDGASALCRADHHRASDQLSHQRLRELVGSALPRLARFRCRLVGKPLGLVSPCGPRSTTMTRLPRFTAQRFLLPVASASSPS